VDHEKPGVCFGLDVADILTTGAALVTTDTGLLIAGATGIKPYTRLVLSVREVCTVRPCIQLAYLSITMPTKETLKSGLIQSFLLTVKINLTKYKEPTNNIKRKSTLFSPWHARLTTKDLVRDSRDTLYIA
jgi:hypothetical protein